MGPFREHLVDAIAINRERSLIYADRTDGASIKLSKRLVLLERLTLPAARWYDWRSAKFRRAGLTVGIDDFVSMQLIEPVSKAPRWSSVADAGEKKRISDAMRKTRREIKSPIRQSQFREVAKRLAVLFDEVASVELSARSHFAMTKHIVESVGMAAVNGARFGATTSGATDRFYRAFLGFQAMGLIDLALSLDEMAQRCHGYGAGILVNDVPEIPFLQRLKAL